MLVDGWERIGYIHKTREAGPDTVRGGKFRHFNNFVSGQGTGRMLARVWAFLGVHRVADRRPGID